MRGIKFWKRNAESSAEGLADEALDSLGESFEEGDVLSAAEDVASDTPIEAESVVQKMTEESNAIDETLSEEDSGANTQTEDETPDEQPMVNQKQEDEEGESFTFPDFVDDEVQDQIEDFAEETGVDVARAAELVMSQMQGDDEDDDPEMEEGEEVGDVEQDGGMHQKDAVTQDELEQKLTEHAQSVEERVIDAVTDDDVIDQIAQKMTESDDFQDEIVETVEQKAGVQGRTPNPQNEPNGDGTPVGHKLIGGE